MPIPCLQVHAGTPGPTVHAARRFRITLPVIAQHPVTDTTAGTYTVGRGRQNVSDGQSPLDSARFLNIRSTCAD
jgi:hypothetical protein